MMMSWNGFCRKLSCPNLKVLSRISSGGTEETQRNIRIAGRWGQESNPVPPENEVGVLNHLTTMFGEAAV
jgi:hypothetical protein